MADWMALNNGVAELDLESLKVQAPGLIAKAAEEERVDWASFVKQAKDWVSEKTCEQKDSHVYNISSQQLL